MISGITVTSGLTAPVSNPRQTHRQTAPSIFLDDDLQGATPVGLVEVRHRK